MSRQFGRTTNQLADVLEMSVGPQMIVYVWPVTRTLRYPMEIFIESLVKRYGSDPYRFAVHAEKHIIIREDTASVVKFTSLMSDPQRYLPIPRFGSIVLDHACETFDLRQSCAWFDVCERMASIAEEAGQWRL